MNKNEIYEKALMKWGKESQLKMLFEEVAELTIALCHFDRGRFKTDEEAFDNIVDEIADVEIMLEQVAQMYKIPTHVIAKQKILKLVRLEKYVTEGS